MGKRFRGCRAKRLYVNNDLRSGPQSLGACSHSRLRLKRWAIPVREQRMRRSHFIKTIGKARRPITASPLSPNHSAVCVPEAEEGIIRVCGACVFVVVVVGGKIDPRAEGLCWLAGGGRLTTHFTPQHWLLCHMGLYLGLTEGSRVHRLD